MYGVHCTAYTVRRTLYGVHCTEYTVRRTLYGVHCTSYTVSVSQRMCSGTTIYLYFHQTVSNGYNCRSMKGQLL